MDGDPAGDGSELFCAGEPLDVDVCAGDVGGDAGAGGGEHSPGTIEQEGLDPGGYYRNLRSLWGINIALRCEYIFSTDQYSHR